MRNPTTDLLQKHFDLALEAPDGIAKLRELILTLAMQGKLVPQDPNDPPAGELLKEIEAEKRRLVKQGKINEPKQFQSILPEEVPFTVPDRWKWVRLGEIGETQTGSTPATKDSDNFGDYLPFIGPGDIKNGVINYEGPGLSRKGADLARIIDSDSVLMVCIGGSIGKQAVTSRRVACNQQINAVTPFIVPIEFVSIGMAAKFFQDQVIAQSSGSATPIINKQKWSSIPLALPPLPEQRRIVAKINQLMAVCDDLEKKRDTLVQKRLAVHNAAIRRLLQAGEASEFSSAWDFLVEHFGEVYSVKENVAELRKAILQLAVMGKLVKQDPNDPPASELLKEVEAEKRRLVKEGKIKAPKPLPPIAVAEVPFEVPAGWEWVRLGELVSLLGDGLHGTPRFDDLGDTHFVNGNNLDDGRIVFKESTKRLSHDEYLIHKKDLTDRSVLVSINGTIGNVAFFRNEKIVLGKSACYFNLLEGTEREYVKLLIQGSFFVGYAMESATGTTINNVSLKAMREFPVPLPPSSEQHRIVAKVDQLMTLCDRLELQIDATITQKSAILKAVLSTA